MALAAEYQQPTVVQPIATEVTVPGTPLSLALDAVLMLIVAAWGAIIPFVGPTFGFRPNGLSAWVWNLPHAVLGLLPGAVAFAAAIMILVRLPLLRRGLGLAGIGLAGALAVLAGAWFVVGPVAAPAVIGSSYYLPASPFRTVVDELGSALGPGLIIVACGAFAIGWSLRQRRVRARYATVVTGGPGAAVIGAPATVSPLSPVAPSGPPAVAAVPVTATPLAPQAAMAPSATSAAPAAQAVDEPVTPPPAQAPDAPWA
jgi:hypothetical protein